MSTAQTSRPADAKLAIRGHALRVYEPSAARRLEALYHGLKWHVTPVVVIAWHAVNWRFDSRQDFQRFREEPALFNNVSREAHQVW